MQVLGGLAEATVFADRHEGAQEFDRDIAIFVSKRHHPASRGILQAEPAASKE